MKEKSKSIVSKLEHDRVKTKVEKLEAAIEEERKERINQVK